MIALMEPQAETFADLIRSVRARRAHTLEAVAQRVGVTLQLVALWENGKRTPSAKRIPALSRYLGVSAQTLRLMRAATIIERETKRG